jgi:hypothetical protein
MINYSHTLTHTHTLTHNSTHFVLWNGKFELDELEEQACLLSSIFSLGHHCDKPSVRDLGTRARARVCVCVCERERERVSFIQNTHTHTHTHTHTYTHTHT